MFALPSLSCRQELPGTSHRPPRTSTCLGARQDISDLIVALREGIASGRTRLTQKHWETLTHLQPQTLPPDDFVLAWLAAANGYKLDPKHLMLREFVYGYVNQMLGYIGQMVSNYHYPLGLQSAYNLLAHLDTLSLTDSQRRRAADLQRKVRVDSFAMVQSGSMVPQTCPIQHITQALPELVPLRKCKAKHPFLLRKGGGPDRPYFHSALYAGSHDLLFGFMASSIATGGYCKIKPVLGMHGEQWVARLIHLDVSKPFPKTAVTEPSGYLKERLALKAANSPFYPQHTFYDSKGRIYDIIPCYDGDLLDLSNQNMDLFEQTPILRYAAKAMLAALADMHEAGWVHRDIKPENMLWRRDGQISLADYGLAERKNELHARAGTLNYMPPEVVDEENIMAAASQDLFSLGLSLVILASPEFESAYTHNVMAALSTQCGPGPINPLARRFSAYAKQYNTWSHENLYQSGPHSGHLKVRRHVRLQSAINEATYWRSHMNQPIMAGWAEPGEILFTGPNAGTPYTLPARGDRATEFDRAIYQLGRIDWPLADLTLSCLLHPDPMRRGTAREALAQLQMYPTSGTLFTDALSVPMKTALQQMPNVALLDTMFAGLNNVRLSIHKYGPY
jgi:serine/threonine protein kinase